MIKNFKDFDSELKGQKIYESTNDDANDIHDDNMDVFAENGIVVPEMLSDNKFLLKISRVVLRKLKQSNLGDFGVRPVIVTIDGVPGVYFYDRNNPEVNIVICRNTNGKHVYLFKEFNMGEENIADLVLSTTQLGFSDIISELISRLSPKSVDEGLICEWVEGGTYNYNETLVAKAASLELDVRQSIVDIIDSISTPKEIATYNRVVTTIWNGFIEEDEICVRICNEIQDVVGGGKRITATGYFKNTINIFYNAYSGGTTHDEVYSVLDGCSSKYSVGSKSSSLITAKTEVSAMIGDDTKAERSDAFKKILEEDTREYMRSIDQIYAIAKTMCKYVKQNCELDIDDLGVMRTRGMLITGKAGSGKSNAIERALKEMEMVENRDYFNVSSGSTSATALYKNLYDYNGKLVIFDDSANMFNADYKVSFWKIALEKNIKKAVVRLSQAAPDNKSNERIYDPDQVRTRQERYFLEVGQIPRKEKEDFINKEIARLEARYKKEHEEESILKDSTKAMIKAKAEKRWSKHLEEKKPKMPSRFNFTGVVIVISNHTRESFKKDVGGQDNWEAISRRMMNFDLHPMAESMWAKIKDTILKQKADTSLEDEERLIPLDITDEFIEEVETLMLDKRYRNMNFGIIADHMSPTLKSSITRPEWKETLKSLMDIKTNNI